MHRISAYKRAMCACQRASSFGATVLRLPDGRLARPRPPRIAPASRLALRARGICSAYTYTPSGARPAQLASPGKASVPLRPRTSTRLHPGGVRRPGVRLFFGPVGSHPLGRRALPARLRAAHPAKRRRGIPLLASRAFRGNRAEPAPPPSLNDPPCPRSRLTSSFASPSTIQPFYSRYFLKWASVVAGPATGTETLGTEEARRGAERRAERHAAARFGGCAAWHGAGHGAVSRDEAAAPRNAAQAPGAATRGAGARPRARDGRRTPPEVQTRLVSPPPAERNPRGRAGSRRTATRRRIRIRRAYPPSA